MATSSSDHGTPSPAPIEATVSTNDLLRYKAKLQSSFLLALQGGVESFTVTLGTHGPPLQLIFSMPTSCAPPASSEGLHFTLDDAMASLQYQPFDINNGRKSVDGNDRLLSDWCALVVGAALGKG